MYLARHVCLLAVAVVCVYTDLAREKLYNAVTLGGLAAGLLIALLLDAHAPGLPHLQDALAGAALGGGLLLILHIFGGMGAGDVKFMAAVGALGGSVKFTIAALACGALVGAGIAIGVLVYKKRLLAGLRDSAKAFFRLRPPAGSAGLTIPYGVALGIGTIWAWLQLVALR